MRISTAFGLVVLLASLASCEVRNTQRCLLPDYPCDTGYFCKDIPGDPNGVGMCVASECNKLAMPTGCTSPQLPICSSAGRCVACGSASDCSAANPALPVCNLTSGSPTFGACVQCVTSSDCVNNPAGAACNQTTGMCQPCTLHSQCPSQSPVCVKDDTLASLPNPLTRGTCVDSKRVLTIDDSCVTGSCQIQPTIAKASADQPYVLIKNLTAKGGIRVPAVAGVNIHIITTTADFSPAQLTSGPPASLQNFNPALPAIVVSPGASVTIEGLAIENYVTGVMCDSDNSTVSLAAPMSTTLTILRSILGSGTDAIITHAKCKLTVDSTWIGSGPTPQFASVGGNSRAITMDSTQFDITNTVINHNFSVPMLTTAMFGGITITDKASLQQLGHIVNCTFDKNEATDGKDDKALAVYCPSAIQTVAIFNNVFVNPTATAGRHYVDPNCLYPPASPTNVGYNATDESPAPPGINIITQGVSEAMLTANLALQTSAPQSVIAGGTLTFSNGADKVTSPAFDMNGTARSTTSPTIGAFETAH